MKIAKAIESYLVAQNEREESTKEKKFYISDMGKCQRMRFLKRKGIKTELSPYVYWIFAMGNMIHDFGYKALEAQSLLLETEQALDADYIVDAPKELQEILKHWSGRFDGKVRNDAGGKSVFDFKSAGGYGMKKAIAGADNDENIAQILTYVMLERMRDPDTSETGVLVYLNKEPKDTMETIVFDREYHLTSIRLKAIKEEMEILTTYWVHDKIPPCTCPTWMKAYNSFQPFCEMTDKTVRNYLKHIEDGKKLISTKNAIYAVTADKKEEIFHL